MLTMKSVTQSKELKVGKSYEVIRVDEDSVTVVNEYGYGKAYDIRLFDGSHTKGLRFKRGNIIDITLNGMPDRITISFPMVPFDNPGAVWYGSILESDNSKCYVTDDWILDHIKNANNSAIYKSKFINSMYRRGYRWCANVHNKKLDKFLEAKKYGENELIEDIIISNEAFYPNGDPKKWYRSIWIKYKSAQVTKTKFRGMETYYGRK